MWIALWRILTRRNKPRFPAVASEDNYAVIKLSKFDNLPVAIIWDAENQGFAVSYEDQHLDAATRRAVEKEIEAVLVNEIANIGREFDGNL
jgi:hypothetical protein